MSSMLALVFTDLVNSTAIKNHLAGDDLDARNRVYRDTILLPHRKRVTDLLSHHEGRVVEEPPGDGFFLVFENVIRAARWAVALQCSHGDDPIATPLGALAVKIGIHIGAPLVYGKQFIGQEVDYAARVSALAGGRQILLSENAAVFIRSVKIEGMTVISLGERFLKGIGAVPIFELLYAGKETDRGDGPVPAPPVLTGASPRDEDEFYLVTPHEERCVEEIRRPGSLLRLKSPRGMGKSSLMARVLARAGGMGYRRVAIDLDQTNRRFFGDLDTFLQWFCASVGRDLGERVRTEDYWDDIFGANDNSTDYFERYILRPEEAPLVLAIDNFDRIFEFPEIETDFCGLLRGWHERAKFKKQWERLRPIVVYSREPYALRDINQSPFNVGLPIELGEFPLDRVRELSARYGLSFADEHLDKLYGLIGGHPHLLQTAFRALSSGGLSLEEFSRTAPTEAGIYSNYLLSLLKILEDTPALKEALRTVIVSGPVARLRPEEAFKLESMGIVKRVGNDVKVRCELFRSYFLDRLGG